MFIVVQYSSENGPEKHSIHESWEDAYRSIFDALAENDMNFWDEEEIFNTINYLRYDVWTELPNISITFQKNKITSYYNGHYEWLIIEVPHEA